MLLCYIISPMRGNLQYGGDLSVDDHLLPPVEMAHVCIFDCSGSLPAPECEKYCDHDGATVLHGVRHHLPTAELVSDPGEVRPHPPAF